MIDYAILCTAIDNWKAGEQPSAAPQPPPRRVSAPAEDEEAVEYSAVYDTNEARPDEQPVDSTVIYQLPEYEEGEEPVETEDDVADVETEADADADADADEEQRA